MSTTIAAQFEAIEALADDLAALARDLDDDAGLCRSTAGSLGAALGSAAGGPAAGAAHGWALLLGLVAGHTGALAGTLREAVASYRQLDAALSDRLLTGRAGVAGR
ncbi:hypothetical protein [Geodermatophilus marinus]|uniref:hypothetical protein n=1 Tax=Geodermatophilus sp. LHW52908 TaxID=2303986 RepID=UPI000E3ECD66|nr:hypothetical protein [Geodermatophilus sp. LHW52908]RFU22219.1 hypothetical protein D0Z06_05980 [Geodermatophilus sp. LHW52908]